MYPTLELIRRLAWRRIREEPLRLSLTVGGVSLGVAVYLSIQLANDSSLRAFRNSLDAISGNTHLQVGAGDRGIPENLFPIIRKSKGVKRAAPVIQQTAWIRKSRPDSGPWKYGRDPQDRAVLVLGLDLLGDSYFRQYTPQKDAPLEEILSRLADPRGVFLTEQLAEDLRVKENDTVQIDAAGGLLFRVRGILKPSGLSMAMEGRVALMDIGVAQEVFSRIGRLDRIDLILEDPGRLEEAKDTIQSMLPPDAVVERPLRRGEDVERMLASFKWNLAALSVIALLVGCFLIFNAMSAAVVRRKVEIGILRSLGMTSRGVARLFLAEAALIGAVGSAVGIVLGFFLAKGTLIAVSQTIRNLYGFLEVSDVYLAPGLMGAAMIAGTGVAVLSGLGPAISASRLNPAEVGREEGRMPEFSRNFLWRTIGWGGVAGLSAFFFSRFPALKGFPVFGYLAALGVIFFLALLSPSFVSGGAGVLRRFLRLGLAGWLAAHGLARHSGRNAVTVASLATAVAMLVSLVIMVESFRETLSIWTEQSIRADFYAAPASRFIKGSAASFPSASKKRVERIEGVAEVDGFRSIRLPWRGGFVEIGGSDFKVAAERTRLPFLEGKTKEVMSGARKRGEAIITETFSNRHGVNRGDVVHLPSANGMISLRIAGVYYDYSTGGGQLIVDRALFRRIWQDDRLSSMAIYLENNTDRARVGRMIEKELDSGMVLISNARLRGRILEVFDQTFAITYALEAIAVLVALLGVATGLSSNILERRREIGALRALGVTQRIMTGAVIGEAGFLGVLSILLGTGGGVGLGAILVFVINKQSFGWTIQFGFPMGTLAGYLLIVVVASLAAGWLPARLASNTPIAEAVREE